MNGRLFDYSLNKGHLWRGGGGGRRMQLSRKRGREVNYFNEHYCVHNIACVVIGGTFHQIIDRLNNSKVLLCILHPRLAIGVHFKARR